MEGILIINKPQWYTSFDVVAKVRKQLNTKKVGHTGTLDPMATGVLVVCVGQATKLVDVLTCEDKIYRTTIKLGIETDTADLTGKIFRYSKDGQIYENTKIDMENLEDTEKNVKYLSDIAMLNYNSNLTFSSDFSFDFSKEHIEKTLQSFIGVQEQIPPMYSAIKVNGKKLYEYARENASVEIPSREIEIYGIYDIDWNGQNELSYTVHCSKGTYIRTLNEDISKKLGTIGTTMALERIKTGNFEINDSVAITDISADKIVSIEQLFTSRIDLDKKHENKLINGVLIDIDRKDGLYNLYTGEKYLGLGRVKNKQLQRYILV